MKVIVVGGGLVGALEAVYMARRGHEVHVYEGRTDIRKEPRYSGLSINLALSVRGIAALREVGVEAEIVNAGIPMHARMIHSHDGQQSSQPYGTQGQAIRSIDRRNLNEHLLSAAEGLPNVHLHFEHKLQRADTKSNTLVFKTPKGEVKATGDLIIGCDGAHSQVRRGLMRSDRVNYQQRYIPHGYKELTIPPGPDGDFQIKANFLHIWPRSTFMMIALPNQDKTFTATLFMPFDKFDSIKTAEDVLELFEAEFPDSIPLIGRERLVKDYFENPTGTLMTVKCDPVGARRTILMGDAAHAVVPFYGQGMNAGFEDCLVFNNLLEKHANDIDAAVADYSRSRVADVHAIADLALYNYVEMRDLVNSRWFLFRKKVDNFLHALMPNTFIPLYTMVTFSQIPYATVVARSKQQAHTIDTALTALAATAVGGAALAAWRYWRL
ncbi:uncharacterized protein MONBRDRAFT_33218 [Monosiga brevicollis MX1]|uniref:Kynurenine 3-monooxygenase n=1 Tax=Monosiga brevicollis TaxID=81824 RepID=A9V478_MONBE|nr:uncharacterized protein MONBRDRAFT_33218 [Monosiga brevicollis MX1]EDQ87572.1 predicted protein [Monosiga brevicollis MX1]|eukprot:XP_001747492.1 hypothetical protein [Monosiga brevicollis MX1]